MARLPRVDVHRHLKLNPQLSKKNLNIVRYPVKETKKLIDGSAEQ
jgi:hypothetical protein